MLTFNHSYDGGTFEESTPLQKFKALHELSLQALFNVEFYISIQQKDMARRYLTLMKYIEDRMRRVEG